MPTFPTLSILQGGVVLLFSAAPHGGLCHHCERVSQWDDLTFHYRCRLCGSDPIVEREDTVAAVAPADPDPVPAGTALPRRRWTDRLPSPRASGASLWSRLGRTPSPTV